jgi:hypothetical protein
MTTRASKMRTTARRRARMTTRKRRSRRRGRGRRKPIHYRRQHWPMLELQHETTSSSIHNRNYTTRHDMTRRHVTTHVQKNTWWTIHENGNEMELRQEQKGEHRETGRVNEIKGSMLAAGGPPFKLPSDCCAPRGSTAYSTHYSCTGIVHSTCAGKAPTLSSGGGGGGGGGRARLRQAIPTKTHTQKHTNKTNTHAWKNKLHLILIPDMTYMTHTSLPSFLPW